MKFWGFYVVFALFVHVAKPLGRPIPNLLLPRPQDLFFPAYYAISCPNLEFIIQRQLSSFINKDPTLAASIIRLHFHDCAVRGCDASILLDHAGSERTAKPSKALRGFEVINAIKAEVDKSCPKTVSCADILAAAARDATLMAGGPFWEVPFGRIDGRVSLAKEAESVPQGHENITALIKFFQERGLDILDLVILSGSHTIGRSTCSSIQPRLSSLIGPDNNIEQAYLNSLRRQCRLVNNYVNLDATTPKTFDAVYYTNLEKKMGSLLTDQLLYSDDRTAPFVSAFASQPSLFIEQFAVSMVKLGNIQSKNRGEIRLNCSCVNP